MTKLSVVAISKNEENDIRFFIEHLIERVDEIVIVDDQSSDRTVNIIQEYDAVKCFEHPMGELGFAGQRNYGIDRATGDWLLHMDIDERLTDELYLEIRSGINRGDHQGFKYRRLNFFLHRMIRHGGWNSWNYPQLAKKGVHRFVNPLHEQCVIEGSVGQLHGLMWHLNDETYQERLRKSNQYVSLEFNRLLEEGRVVKPYHLILKPIWEFIKKYLLKSGFKDGTVGLIAAIHSAVAVFRILALTWDSQNRITRTEIEHKLNRK